MRDFAFFLGGKSSSSLATLDDILWSRRTSGKNSLFDLSKQIGPVESRIYASGWTNNVTAAVTANVSRIQTCKVFTDGRAIVFCLMVKTNAADPSSVLIDLEAIVPSHQNNPCAVPVFRIILPKTSQYAVSPGRSMLGVSHFTSFYTYELSG